MDAQGEDVGEQCSRGEEQRQGHVGGEAGERQARRGEVHLGEGVPEGVLGEVRGGWREVVGEGRGERALDPAGVEREGGGEGEGDAEDEEEGAEDAQGEGGGR